MWVKMREAYGGAIVEVPDIKAERLIRNYKADLCTEPPEIVAREVIIPEPIFEESLPKKKTKKGGKYDSEKEG